MTRRVCFRKTVLWFAVLLFTYVAAVNVNNAMAEQLAFAAPGPYQITGIETSKADDGIILRVTGSAPPTFTMYELFEPQRIILDIADGSFVHSDGSVVESLEIPMEAGTGPITKIKGQILNDKKPLIARLEMFTTGEASYTVERAGNDILVNVKKKEAAAEAPSPRAQKSAATGPALVAATKKSPAMTEKQAKPDAPMEQKVAPAQAPEADAGETAAVPVAEKSEPISMPSQAPAGPSPVLDEFAYAGYEKQPITVDFYKIDLHNVFRLFGELSGMNIVVAQGVGGTLTLALDNVPWDFVLDVILNLQNLQAIERYNTIVIAPKGATFEWPEREAEKVAVKKDSAILMEGEKLQVVQKMEMSPEVLEAQKLIREGRALEKQEQFEDALMLYEKAFEMWPDNGKLAGRLASLYLVHMGMNAKAVYYGKEALKIDENDATSALYTAIGLANMKRNAEAKEYFEMAVSSKRPDSEALISYAMFSEENGSYLDALLLLARHEDLYGDSLDTMIARARILDKEGNSDKAAAEYRAILLSGYQLPADLTRFIKGRLALEGTQSKGQM
jgi:type IV pilus assembly protein PilQ